MTSRTVYVPKHLALKIANLNWNLSKILQEALVQKLEGRNGICSQCGSKLEEGETGMTDSRC